MAPPSISIPCLTPSRKQSSPSATSTSKSASTAPTAASCKSTPEPLPEPMVSVLLKSWDDYNWNGSARALTDWLNARWTKTGYSVSEQTVCFYLRVNGRDAKMSTNDRLNAAFVRDSGVESGCEAVVAQEEQKMIEVGAEVRMLADPRLDRLRALSERLTEKAELEFTIRDRKL